MDSASDKATGTTLLFLNFGDHPWTLANIDVMTAMPAANPFAGG